MTAAVVHLGSRRTLAPCPLPFSRVLRRNAARPRGRERALVEDWLRANGWRFERDGFGWSWWDPATGLDHGIVGAVRAQATHEAQRLLAPLGYVMTSGGSRDDVWTYVLEVRKADGYDAARRCHRWAPGSSYRSLLSALRAEGVA
jgi:hypothetical protein